VKKFLLFSLLFSVVACPQLNAMEAQQGSGSADLVDSASASGNEEELEQSQSWFRGLVNRLCFWRKNNEEAEVELGDDGYAKVKRGILTRPICWLLVAGGVVLAVLTVAGVGGITGPVAYRERELIRFVPCSGVYARLYGLNPRFGFDIREAMACIAGIEESELRSSMFHSGSAIVPTEEECMDRFPSVREESGCWLFDGLLDEDGYHVCHDDEEGSGIIELYRGDCMFEQLRPDLLNKDCKLVGYCGGISPWRMPPLCTECHYKGGDSDDSLSMPVRCWYCRD